MARSRHVFGARGRLRGLVSRRNDFGSLGWGCVVVGAELVVGYVFAWFAGKGRRAARRADGQVDQAVDAAVDRLGQKLHELVAGKLDGDPSLVKLQDEASQGGAEPSERTRTRVALALEDAAEQDPRFGVAIEELVRQLHKARGGVSSGEGGAAVGGDVRVQADNGAFAAGIVQGDVSFQNPQVPGTGLA
jgi:hypothetical protein